MNPSLIEYMKCPLKYEYNRISRELYRKLCKARNSSEYMEVQNTYFPYLKILEWRINQWPETV